MAGGYMMCWHKYKYVGYIKVYYWLGGVASGVPFPATIEARQCTRCGKIKEK